MGKAGGDGRAKRRSQLLVFVHIPKTAGTTLRAILNMNEPGPRTQALGNVFKGGGGLSKELIGRLRDGKGPELKGVGLVRGHFPLGIREYIRQYIRKDTEVRWFTFLRDPVDRTLSHYFQVVEYEGSHELPPLPASATLEDALEGGYIHDNLHTRMLSGIPDPFGEVTEEMLERAKRNLREELVFFGLTERFDESLVLAKQRLGFRGILYRSSSRVNDARPRGREVPAELARAAERCNRYDIELYREARELFDAAPELGELEFEVELAALRAAKADGELALDVPPPDRFDGGPEAWRMLLVARAELQRAEWQHARSRLSGIARTAEQETLESELSAARSRVNQLDRQLERVKTASAEKSEVLKDRGERLRATRSRKRELEEEVQRLRDGGSRPKGSKRAKARRPKGDAQRRRKKAKASAAGGTPEPDRGVGSDGG
jgi:hypothetical protein